jgi:2-oxoglutarate dehydrogenase E2 component (dihydrolipoamide succinyltransferase)
MTIAEIDMHKTYQLREKHKNPLKAEGVNLTFLAFVAAATVRGLRENPLLNARVLDNAFVKLKHINLGIAVETPEGLVVPVVRDADRLTVRGLAVAIDEVAQRARAGKITADDLAGATFTISNPGLKGNFVGAAVISQPNVGILRTGEMVKRPVVVEQDGQDMIAIHPVMFAALSYDHRIVDGVAANNFLYRVTELLEAGTFDV